MKRTYTIIIGREAHRSFSDVFDYVSLQPDATIVAGEDSNHRRLLKVITDERTMSHIRAFACGWNIEKPMSTSTAQAKLTP